MKLIEVPFRPDQDNGWTIPIPGGGEKQFKSRDEALAFALKLAKQQQRGTNATSRYLCVEGADGQWRLFTSDLLPVRV
ncbi:DUF2188 domain-containing protein [Rhodanobacter umsongensis]|uniref:DUF2188 domain-containing protein n=1 Tax=Rhodanobacter umsongensis TaxID=633153 RepID=A0ABW0JHJ1_9GAMM